jgi:hypothetical protein
MDNSGVRRILAGGFLAATVATAAFAAETLADLLAAVKRSDGRIIFENSYVRVHNTILEYPSAPRRVAEERPVVLYVRLGSDRRTAKTQLLELPPKARPPWQPGIVPLGIWIELLKPPPKYSTLGDPGTYQPRKALEEKDWGDGSLYVATFLPFDYAVGLGPTPGVAVFLSDGVVEVSSKGLRRRMAVQAGYAEWFDERTRLTVMDDYPIGVAFLQVPSR